MWFVELRKTNILAEEAGGDCVISDCYVGVWENEKEGKKNRERWERQGYKSFGHFIWNSSPLRMSAPGVWDWFHLKHLKEPGGIHARFWNKYQDRSWIVFKLNAICQRGGPSFLLFFFSFPLDLSIFYSMPASFCFHHKRILRIFFFLPQTV